MVEELGFDFPDTKRLCALQFPERPLDPVGTRV